MTGPARACLAGLVLLLGGCAETDPYRRIGAWQPNGANSLNLAAMLVQPRDLIRGRGTTGTPGVEATPAVTRFWAGRPAPLPTSSSQAGAAAMSPSATPTAGPN